VRKEISEKYKSKSTKSKGGVKEENIGENEKKNRNRKEKEMIKNSDKLES